MPHGKGDRSLAMPMGWPLILASASPRREALLRQIGLSFTVQPSAVEESGAVFAAAGDPGELVRKYAYQKALDVATRVERALVIGADTVVTLDGEIMGKPEIPRQAVEMLSALSGRTHEVHTGMAVMRVGGEPVNPQVDEVVTRVQFRELEDDEIRRYVATGEPMDKAGAYAIQGKGAVLVAGIEGDYYNVVGLPLARLAQMLHYFGVQLW